MFGLLGPNGAGKSTLMRCVATLQTPTSGKIRFDDIDVIAEPEKLRRVLGYLPQDFGVYPRVSAYAMLDHMAVLKGIARPRERRDTVEALLQQTNLWTVRKKALAGFSGGMRQRFGIAQALIGRSGADHRRRTDRRARSGRAQPLPQPAFGNRREVVVYPFDPYRRGRFRSLPAHGDHRRRPHRDDRRAGRADGISRAASGARSSPRRISKPIVSNMSVILTRLFGGQTLIHILSDNDPGDGFQPSIPGWKTFILPRSPRTAGGLSDVQQKSPRSSCAISSLARVLGAFGIFFLLVFGATTSLHPYRLGRQRPHEPALRDRAVARRSCASSRSSSLTAFVANVVVRDDETGFGPIVRATRVRKFDYLFGRFTGAFFAAADPFCWACRSAS